jgi:tRNA 2-thiouridine synthesizing protein A
MSHPKASHVVDARYMEPPEPFVQTMEMLDTLKPGEKMLLLLYREPHPLYKVLRQNGHAYETELLADGTFEILIWR